MENRVKLQSLLPLFFLSGMAGLMYELSWIRESALIFGATLPALTTVTALFFGGMALGNRVQSRKSANYSGALLGKIELSVAISGVLSIFLMALFRNITPSIYPSFHDSELLLTLYRILAIALTIGIPTFFIGMTFPVMMAITPTEEGDEGKIAGLVNGFNALGAVIGTLLTGFVLIPHLGMTGTILVAAAINAIVGVRFLRSSITVTRATKEVASSEIKLFPALPLFFTLGFCGMAGQILWSRFLALIIHNTVYTYTITITAVISGISLGSLISAKLSSKERDFSKLFGILTVVNLTSFIAAIYLPAFIWLTIGSIHSELLKMFIIAAILFVPSLFSGAAFPVALKMIGGGSEVRGRIAGLLSASNTFGSILGSFLAGFFLLPWIGISGTAAVTAGLLLATIIVAFLQAKRMRATWMLIAIPVIVLAIFFRSPKEFVKDFVVTPNERVEYIKEGIMATVSVATNSVFKTMKIDQLWQGESRKTRQIMAAHLPMLLAKNPKKALVIGVGAGETARRFTLYKIDSLDLIDLEPAVFTAAEKYFDGGWMNQPGVKKIVTDGRSYIMNANKSYDVISIEIGQVFRPHAAGFYSKEFYQGVEKRLTSTGVVGQFIPIAAFSEQTFKRVIASFIEVFPHSQLWFNSSEFVLLGFKGKEPTLFNKTVMHELNPGTPIFTDLAFNYWGGELYNLNQKNVLAAGFLMKGEDLSRLTSGAKSYSDKRPELEYVTAAVQENPPFLSNLMPFLSPVEQIIPGVSMVDIRTIEEIRRINLDNILTDELLLLYQSSGSVEFLQKALEYNPKNIRANRMIAEYYYKTAEYDSAEKHLIQAFAQDPGSTDAGYQIAVIRLKKKDVQGAIEVLYEILSDDPQDEKANALMGVTLTQIGNFKIAEHHLSIAIERNPSNREAREALEFIKSQKSQEK